MKVVTTLLLIAITTMPAFALMQAYSVEPVKASWSGEVWGHPQYGGISQTITCNFDSLKRVELFVGGYSDTGAYKVDVYEVGGGAEPVARNHGVTATQPHSWLKMPLTTETGYKFTKGKQYEFKFTRAGSDSLQYYWQEGQAVYPWGFMTVDGESSIPIKQLCMRAYGVMDTIGADWFGVNPYFPFDVPCFA